MIVVYLKPTNRCNVGCRHCYVSSEKRASRERMAPDTFAASIDFVKELSERYSDPTVHIVWHGGEPMLLPVDWYRAAGRLIDQELPFHTESMQTSMIPYHGDFGALARERFRGGLGSSIDSSRTLSGSTREYQQLWLAKVAAARADGVTVVPGIVPARADIPKGYETVEWFKTHGFNAFNVDRYSDVGGQDKSCPSNAEHGSFLVDLFDAVMGFAKQGSVIEVNTVAAALRGVLYGLPGDRWGSPCQRNHLVIEPDGTLNSCPDIAGTGPGYHNVADGVGAYLESIERRQWVRYVTRDRMRPNCRSCSYMMWCKGGCPITPNTVTETECAGYVSYLDHVARWCMRPDGRHSAERYLVAIDEPIAVRTGTRGYHG